MKQLLLLSAALAATMFAAPAFAGEGSAGFYRVEAGNSNLEIDSNDSNELGFSLRGGYFFNANFGIEGFYTDLGRDSDDSASVEAHAFGIGAIAKKNFGSQTHEGFFINARAGISRIDLNVDIDGFGIVDDGDNQPYYGIGAGYDFNEKMGVSLNVDRFKSDLFDTDLTFTTTTAAFEYRF
jgi:OOP family OmpA-OmpF porin